LHRPFDVEASQLLADAANRYLETGAIRQRDLVALFPEFLPSIGSSMVKFGHHLDFMYYTGMRELSRSRGLPCSAIGDCLLLRRFIGSVYYDMLQVQPDFGLFHNVELDRKIYMMDPWVSCSHRALHVPGSLTLLYV
jgi:hypothetical protein